MPGRTRSNAMEVDPIAGILAAQTGYGPKCRGTVWNLMFLDQLGADPDNGRIQRACDYVLTWSRTGIGPFGASGSHLEGNPPPLSAIHCLDGNLVRALIRFGLDHPTVRAATDRAARSILGEHVEQWSASGTSGPGFACAADEGLPHTWRAIKEMLATAAIPMDRRTVRLAPRPLASIAYIRTGKHSISRIVAELEKDVRVVERMTRHEQHAGRNHHRRQTPGGSEGVPGS